MYVVVEVYSSRSLHIYSLSEVGRKAEVMGLKREERCKILFGEVMGLKRKERCKILFWKNGFDQAKFELKSAWRIGFLQVSRFTKQL